MKKILFTSLFASILLTGALVNSNESSASQLWVANTPEMLVIQNGQSSYTLVLGDTLWAISQRTNLNVQTLADINGINLSLGEQYNLPVGRVISFDGNKVTVTDATGAIVNEVTITEEQKVNPNQEVGVVVNPKITESDKNEGLSEKNPSQPNLPVVPEDNGNNGGGGAITPEVPVNPEKPVEPTEPEKPIDPEAPVDPEKIYRGEFIDGVNNGAVGTWTNKDEMMDYISEHWAENTANGTWTDNYAMTTNGYGWIAEFY